MNTMSLLAEISSLVLWCRLKNTLGIYAGKIHVIKHSYKCRKHYVCYLTVNATLKEVVCESDSKMASLTS